MAELDDFFAKKDRKKCKDKPSFLSVNDLLKTMKQDVVDDGAAAAAAAKTVDEEKKVYPETIANEEQKVVVSVWNKEPPKNYSGLKLKQLINLDWHQLAADMSIRTPRGCNEGSSQSKMKAQNNRFILSKNKTPSKQAKAVSGLRKTPNIPDITNKESFPPLNSRHYQMTSRNNALKKN